MKSILIATLTLASATAVAANPYATGDSGWSGEGNLSSFEGDIFGSIEAHGGFAMSSAVMLLGVRGIFYPGDGIGVLYPSFSQAMGGGRVAYGIPESAFAYGYVPGINMAGLNYFEDFAFFELGGSPSEQFYLMGDAVPIGVRYDASSGGTDYGFSGHIVTDGVDQAFVLSAAARRTFGGISSSGPDAVVFGGFEAMSEPGGGSVLIAAAVGVEGQSGLMSYGANLRGWFGDGPGEYVFGNAYVGYDVMPDLTVTGAVLSIESDTLFALGAEYRFGPSFSADATVLSDGPSGSAFEFSLGFNF